VTASWLGSILAIFLVDLVLSGDNAVVIGAAASELPRQQRRLALLVGGSGAIVARILFALAATLLLQLRFVGIIGGAILLFIAIRLLIERNTQPRSNHARLPPTAKPLQPKKTQPIEQLCTQMDLSMQKKRVPNRLLPSITTILLADVTMSLDNILAIGGLAAGNLLTLIIGLVLSVIFLLIGSALVAELISRLPWLLDVACLIVAWTAAQIFLGDDFLTDFLARFPWTSSLVPAAALIMVLVFDLFLYLRDRQRALHL
jgi:YjbE family integral membrane protein